MRAVLLNLNRGVSAPNVTAENFRSSNAIVSNEGIA